MTPAQQAKEFAAANGFVIAPNGRRYAVTYPAAQFDTFVADVGGYPAALNAMHKYADELKTAESIAWIERAGLADKLQQPDNVVSECNAPARVGGSLFDAPKVTTVDERIAFYAQERIRKEAKRIRRRERRRDLGPVGGSWHVIFNGSTVMKYGYPSRAEAVGVVRWGFNHVDPRIRNNWRTATLAVEYRAS